MAVPSPTPHPESRTSVQPSMAAFNGKLYVAWQPDGTTSCNILECDENGVGNVIYTSRSGGTKWPSITATDTSLIMAFTGVDNDSHLNIWTVQLNADRTFDLLPLGQQPTIWGSKGYNFIVRTSQGYTVLWLDTKSQYFIGNV